MTGARSEADDLAQEAAARAIERAEQADAADPIGWLVRLTTRVCIDHLRHRKVVRRATALVDPLSIADWPDAAAEPCAAEGSTLRREDVRFAIVVAFQRLSSRQRAVLVLHDVCDRPLADVAEVLKTNPNAAKALLRRARAALAGARIREDVDVPVDAAVVERFARAVEAGAIDVLTELLAEDAWGITDGGGVVAASTKPNFGRRAVSRQWSNAKRRLGVPVTTSTLILNGEAAIVIRLAPMPEVLVAVVHLETRVGHVAALRVNRDPNRLGLVATLSR
jgi:RNA polymerase sigma-70 factor (ECF subfamily)